jgi:hypothetical protein
MTRHSELHLLIDWKQQLSEEALSEFPPTLQLEKRIVCPALGRNKGKVMTQFYGCPVNDFRGETPFTLYILRDTAPLYLYRTTTKGKRRVNAHLFDLKKQLRRQYARRNEPTCVFHGTDNIQETKDNLRALGLFKQHYPQRSFRSLAKAFEHLNSDPSFQWLALRNFKQMPTACVEEHTDVDILVSDYFAAKALLDAEGYSSSGMFENGGYCVLNTVIIADKPVLFDFCYVGDGYYDSQFQRDMLAARELRRECVYCPTHTDYQLSLLYHGIVHKTQIAKKYADQYHTWWPKMNMKRENLYDLLTELMEARGYNFTKPEASVRFNLHRHVKHQRRPRVRQVGQPVSGYF